MKKFRMDPYSTDTPRSYPTSQMRELFVAILKLKTTGEAEKFFRDLLTIAEITEFANRWQMVKLLSEGTSYAKVSQKLKVSTTTVARVAHWLHNGMGGYQLVADRVFASKQTKSSKPFRLRGKRTWG